MKSVGKGTQACIMHWLLMGNANAAGVNHHDPQVLEVEHANYLAKSSFFVKRKESRK